MLEEMEEKCKDAKELLFENNRKFSEATRLLAMRQFDVEAVTARINKALEEIEEHKEMQKQSSVQMMHAEKRGGRNVERQLEQEQRIEATTNQIETIDDCTEDALRSINKLEHISLISPSSDKFSSTALGSRDLEIHKTLKMKTNN